MAKSKIQILDVNCETGEQILRDATPDEIAQLEADAKNALVEKELNKAKSAARQAIAERLGLTADELQVLLG
jgi:hypothetical protein